MDSNLESAAADEFARLYRLDPSDRNSTPSVSPDVRERADSLLAAHDRNRADRFLEPVPSAPTEELQRWLRENAEIDVPPSIEAAPTTIGSFRILEPIAQGDLCSIYLAAQTTPVTRRAAIKVLHSTARRRETLRRFDIERQSIAAMRHPNIAQFFEAGASESGHAYFAMEYIDGPPITVHCTREKLPMRDRLQLFLQVCGAVAHAHQRGIVHRDLKPSNILISTEVPNSPAQAKVIDFGVAKAMESSPHEGATFTGQVVGTLAYMSPEQLRGQTHLIDTRSDIFALGLILFEMLAETPAYRQNPDDHQPLRRDSDAPARLRSIRPEFRGDLDTIVAKASALDPEQRYSTVAELAEDIRRSLDGRAVLARDPGVLHIAFRFVKRNRIATAAAVLVVAAGAVSALEIARARAQRSDLGMQIAQAWMDMAMDSQRTLGESGKRAPGVAKMTEQIRRFASQLPDDERAQSMLASAVTEKGYDCLEANDPIEARDNFQEALSLRRRLADAGFGPLGGLGQLSLALVRCGDAAQALHDSRTRDVFYREALELDERAARLYPREPMALSNLGWSLERMGMLLHDRDPARLAWFERQIKVFEQFVALAPIAEAHRGASGAYQHAGRARIVHGIPALDYATRSLVHARAATRLAPTDRLAVRIEISAELFLAETTPDPEMSAREFLRALSRAEEYAALDPADFDSRKFWESCVAYGQAHFARISPSPETRAEFDAAERRFRAAPTLPTSPAK
ncbi:MAG: protein kinase [Planctomycetes bacterium]|nr:protein kinase [Planctomycetota bacterium]